MNVSARGLLNYDWKQFTASNGSKYLIPPGLWQKDHFD